MKGLTLIGASPGQRRMCAVLPSRARSPRCPGPPRSGGAAGRPACAAVRSRRFWGRPAAFLLLSPRNITRESKAAHSGWAMTEGDTPERDQGEAILRLPKSDLLAQKLVGAIHAGEVERVKDLITENQGLAAARLVDHKGGGTRHPNTTSSSSAFGRTLIDLFDRTDTLILVAVADPGAAVGYLLASYH